MDKVKGKPREAQNKSHRVTTTGDIEVSTYLEIAKEIGGEQPIAAKEAVPAAEREVIIVIDFGSQYSMLSLGGFVSARSIVSYYLTILPGKRLPR